MAYMEAKGASYKPTKAEKKATNTAKDERRGSRESSNDESLDFGSIDIGNKGENEGRRIRQRKRMREDEENFHACNVN